ncbi:303_t:CDS:2, partial [Entrophospora sp. SA101]
SPGPRCSNVQIRDEGTMKYYNIPGSSRVDFWNSIAITINQRFGTTYTGQQCNNRFQNLVRDYNLEVEPGRGVEQITHEFTSYMKYRFDMLHNTNTSTRRRRRNRTPPPSYEVSTILSTSRRESTTNQRNRSASPTQRATSERSENISETATTNNNQDNRRNENTSETATTNNNQDNTRNENTSETVTTGNNQDNGNNVNNVNDVSENSGHNVNDVDENLDNVRYLSSSELANITSSINISASQNDSDVSMFDVEDSQPPSYMESINEERNP